MYKASIENNGDSRHYATTRHAGFVFDTEGKGVNPIDALLASLCGCMGHYVRDYLVDHQISHNGFTIEAEAGVTPDKARLAGIKVSIDLKDVRLDDRQAAEMLKVIETCKVYKILKVDPSVSVSLADRQASGFLLPDPIDMARVRSGDSGNPQEAAANGRTLKGACLTRIQHRRPALAPRELS